MTAASDTFRIERSIVVDAAPDRIFPIIADFHRWVAWSPYEGLDPKLARTFEGAASGKGAIYAWVGNNKVGNGRMEILEASAPSRIVIKLDFYKPFEAHNTAEFTVAPEGEGASRVTWAMYGPKMDHGFLFKLMGLFFNMDKMVGGQFEEGLANLKAVAEGRRTDAA